MIDRRRFIAGILPALASCGRSHRRLIGVVPKANSHLFFVSVHAGVDQAARDYGVDILWNGPQEETDYTRQIAVVDSMVTRGVDALAISATDERALAAPVERAIRAGIPVAVFDSGVNVEDYTSFVATDNYGAGCTAARTLAALIGGSGKVAMVAHKPGGTSTLSRESGFEDTVRKEFPKITIAAKQFGMSDQAKSLAVAEDMLTAVPDMKGMFASSEPSSLGAIHAVESGGYSGKIRVVTFDFSDTHVQALRGGVIDAMVVQDPFRIGYEAVKSLAEKLNGKTPEHRLDLPARVITRADLDKPDVQALLFPPWLKRK
jgi:ribose transport system substrate-binding protein